MINISDHFLKMLILVLQKLTVKIIRGIFNIQACNILVVPPNGTLVVNYV